MQRNCILLTPKFKVERHTQSTQTAHTSEQICHFFSTKYKCLKCSVDATICFPSSATFRVCGCHFVMPQVFKPQVHMHAKGNYLRTNSLRLLVVVGGAGMSSCNGSLHFVTSLFSLKRVKIDPSRYKKSRQ